MRKKFASALKELRGNRGSGIILVLVCMLCVSMLGAMILYLSYTGMQLKLTERQSKKNFYDASTAMDEIRAGIQTAASDSIAEAYRTVLINYSNADYINNSTMTDKFREEFQNDFRKWQRYVTTDGKSSEINLITGTSYNTAVLKSFVSEPAAAIDETGTHTVTVSQDAIVLKNVRVTYKDSKDYETQITTDISVGMPDFSYVLSSYSAAGLPAFALIAQRTLSKGIGDSAVVTGSTYADNIAVSAGSLNMKDGTVICRTLISSINAGGTFTSGGTLWANRIQVGSKTAGNCAVTLSGTTYVQDDLDLLGYNSVASLSGKYYGFGNSQTDSSMSSAILVNGRSIKNPNSTPPQYGTKLDLSGLTRLMLAGHSFVENVGNDTVSGNHTNDVRMGESASVRGNQTAYLIPVQYLNSTGSTVTSNPFICADSSVPTGVSLNIDKTLWSGKTFASYGASVKQVLLNYPGAAGYKIAYYFMQFDTEANANAYFKDYFSNNTANIKTYLDGYLSDYNSPATVQSAGWTLKKNTDGSYSLGTQPVQSGSLNTTQLSTMFSQLTHTLFASGKYTDDTNPYTYFVDTDKISSLPKTGVVEFKDDSGNVVGIVTNGDYTITDKTEEPTPETVCVVIASGNVTVSRNFTGLVIAGGDITLNASVNVNSSETQVTAAMSAKTTGGDILSSFLKNGAANSSTSGGSGSSWNLDKIVTYQNWSKY